MIKNQIHFKRVPFQDTIDSAFFFPGSRRKEIVDGIKSALTDTVPLIILTGADGSGKTMICRMVEKELPLGLVSVFLPRTVESFDDMVHIVAQEINVGQGEDEEESETRTLVHEIVSALKARGQRLLIIFDEAEKIYLATLERIRKMLDQVNTEGVVFQMLLSGDSLLENNFKQLSIVSFQDIEERHFSLDPLDPEEIWMYLNSCITIATGKECEIFSRDIVKGLFTSSNGNFRKINHLAQESLESEKLDTSFLALLDTIKDKTVVRKDPELPLKRSRVASSMPEVNLDYLKFPRIRPEWLFLGGGVCAIALLLFLLMGRSKNDDTVQDATITDVPIIELKVVEPLGIKETPEQPLETGVPPPVLLENNNKQIPPVPAIETVEKQPEAAVTTSPVASGKKIEQLDGDHSPKQPEEVVVVPQVGQEGSTLPEPEPVSVLDKVERQPEPAAAVERPSASPELETEQIVRSPGETVGEKTVGVASNSEKIVVQPMQEKKQHVLPPTVAVLDSGEKKRTADSVTIEPAKKRTVARGGMLQDVTVEEIYSRRLAAGARWLVGGGQGNYTVQLMVLTSEKAENNLKNMLKESDYRTIANQLFILRRVGSLSTVVVFYGEYPTLAAARNARNTLPVFLRKHHPYAISIDGAVAKTTATQ